MDYHKIVFRPDVPTDPDKMREWLQQWHKEHNPSQADDQPGYIATDQGRQLLGLAIGGKN